MNFVSRPRILHCLTVALFAIPATAEKSGGAVSNVIHQSTNRVIIERTIQSDALDVLIVVDDSGSMANSTAAIESSVTGLADAAARLKLNINFGFIVTSIFPLQSGLTKIPADGRLQSNRIQRFTNTRSTDFLSDFNSDLSFVKDLVLIGGNGFEKPLTAIQRALSPERIAVENAGFRRPSARFLAWVFTDADDQSEIPASDFVSQLRKVTGDPNATVVATYIPLPNGDGSNSTSGPSLNISCDRSGEYEPDVLTEVLKLSGGYDFSLNLCDPDLKTKTQAQFINWATNASGPGAAYPSVAFEPIQLSPTWKVDWRKTRVELDGVELPFGDKSLGFVYNSRTNTIYFGKDLVISKLSALLKIELVLL